MKNYQFLAQAIRESESTHPVAKARGEARVEYMLKYSAPSGSGIDCGTQLHDKSTPDKLVFLADFHHMNEVGYYDGWTNHLVIVTPSLENGFDIRITGRNRNDIKEYLSDVYRDWLDDETPEEAVAIKGY